jgi:hypothetical protein
MVELKQKDSRKEGRKEKMSGRQAGRQARRQAGRQKARWGKKMETVADLKVLRHKILLTRFFLCSFLADYQMVLDAQIRVTVTKDGPDNTTITSDEILAPSRHRITLPLNGLNILFNECTVSFNHHLKLDSDRSVLMFLPSLLLPSLFLPVHLFSSPFSGKKRNTTTKHTGIKGFCAKGCERGYKKWGSRGRTKSCRVGMLAYTCVSCFSLETFFLTMTVWD